LKEDQIEMKCVTCNRLKHKGNTVEEKTLTSSLNEISTDQQGNRAVVGGCATPPSPTPSYKEGLRQIFKDDVNEFLFSLDIFMG
jgi:hypothetical protein